MKDKKYCNPAETGKYECGISCIRQNDVNLWFYTKNSINYYHLGLKLGSSNVAGTMTTVLSASVSRVVVKWIGFGAKDTLTVGDCEPVASGKKYNAEGVELREDRFDITASNEVTFAFAKRGFIQAIEYYTAE